MPKSRARSRGRGARQGFIAWLDFGRADLDKAFEIIFPSEEDTVDELGLGRLTDTVSERFYPATTVLMTRPRYLYLVRAIYHHLQERQVPVGHIDAERKRLEDLLRASLERHATEGVLGRIAKDNLKRYRSSIYWRALSTLGFLTLQCSQPEYLADLAARDEDDTIPTDDDTSIGEEIEHIAWNTAAMKAAASDIQRIISSRSRSSASAACVCST